MTCNILFGGVGREQMIREVIGAIQPDVAVFTEVTKARSFESIARAVGPHSAGRNGRHAREYTAIASRWPIIQSALHRPPWAHPSEGGFTVPAWNPRARLDDVFAAPELKDAFRSSGILAPTSPAGAAPSAPRRSVAELPGWKAIAPLGNHASDHLPVWADFEWPSEEGSSTTAG